MFSEEDDKRETENDRNFVQGKTDKEKKLNPQSNDYYYMLGYNDDMTKKFITVFLSMK